VLVISSTRILFSLIVALIIFFSENDEGTKAGSLFGCHFSKKKKIKKRKENLTE
jgi:hypothetical protein